MSVQVKGSGTIGGLDEGLVVSGIVTSSTQINVGSNIKLGSAGVVTATSFSGSGANLTGIDTDLVADTSPQLGGDLASNSHDVLFADNDKAIFGTGSDFKIYHNGTDNYIMASNGHIRFDTGSAELARITSTGKLLVGTQTEGAANADDLTIATTGTTGITIRSGTSNSGNIYFSDATSGTGEYAGAIEYNHSDNSLRLFTNTGTERLRITSDGKLTMSSGTVELQSHMVRVGNRTTSQINAGVSTSTGALTLDTTTNLLKYYANSEWATVKKQVNDGSTQTLAARSAKALLDDGITTSGVYWLDMHGAYSSGNAKRHYCLQDTSYNGGGWTLLYSMNHGNNFASGSNYSFALNVGSPTSINDFTASNFGYDRRNTFTPQANDQFLIRRSDNNDWKRFVVTTWSPTANSISDGWSCTRSTEGTNRGHPYYALGQMYDSSGNSVSGMVHFNGCALGGNCNSGGGDGDGFGDHVNWSSGYSPYNCWGGAFNGQGNGGSPLYWGQGNTLSQGGSLYVQMFYRRTGTQ